MLPSWRKKEAAMEGVVGVELMAVEKEGVTLGAKTVAQVLGQVAQVVEVLEVVEEVEQLLWTLAQLRF